MIFAHTWRQLIGLPGYPPKDQTRRLPKPNESLKYATWIGPSGGFLYHTRSGAWTRPVVVYDNPSSNRRVKWQCSLPGIDQISYSIQTGYPPHGGLTVGRFIIRDIWQDAVNRITEEEAIAEGFEPYTIDDRQTLKCTARDQFANQWDEIHFLNRPRRYWQKNAFHTGPLVWVLSIEVVAIHWSIVESIDETK